MGTDPFSGYGDMRSVFAAARETWSAPQKALPQSLGEQWRTALDGAERVAAGSQAVAADGVMGASVRQQAPVGGSRWRNQLGTALFDGGHEVVGEKNGLPIVRETDEEREASMRYLREQSAARGQDPDTAEFITVRAPVFDGATGPLVGYYEGTAMRLDMSYLKLVKGDAIDLPDLDRLGL